MPFYSNNVSAKARILESVHVSLCVCVCVPSLFVSVCVCVTFGKLCMCLSVSLCACVCVSVCKISALWTMFTNPVCDQSHLRSLLLDVYTEETFQKFDQSKAKQSKAMQDLYRDRIQVCSANNACAHCEVHLGQYCLHILCNLLPHHTQCIGYSARDEWSWPSLGGVGGSRWYASIADKADAMSMEVQISGNMDFRIAQH